jgi:hypothetical protein
MIIILSFSDTAFLSSVMICCTTVETINMSLLEELGTCIDRPHFLLWQMLLHKGPQAFPVCLWCPWPLMLRVLTSAGAKDCSGEVNLEKNILPRGSLESSLCSSFAMLQLRCDAGRGFSPLFQGAIAAARDKFCVCLFRTFATQVPTTAPQTSKVVACN